MRVSAQIDYDFPQLLWSTDGLVCERNKTLGLGMTKIKSRREKSNEKSTEDRKFFRRALGWQWAGAGASGGPVLPRTLGLLTRPQDPPWVELPWPVQGGSDPAHPILTHDLEKWIKITLNRIYILSRVGDMRRPILPGVHVGSDPPQCRADCTGQAYFAIPRRAPLFRDAPPLKSNRMLNFFFIINS